MTIRKSMFLLATLAVVALALGACSDSSTTPGDNDTDTTAPLVAGTSPSSGQVNVASYANITVTFNEPIDQATVAAAVTVAPGGAGAITWLTDRQMSIANPGGWAEGVEVTVTLGTGIADLAGNHLAGAHVFSFFVESNALLLLDTEPAEDATGVSRSASIRLQFSHEVDVSTLTANTFIGDATAKSDGYAYTVSSGSNNWYTLDPVDNLPAGASLYVSVGAAVAAAGNPSNTLGTLQVLHFTTGVDVDTTPPTIVSFQPADGSTNLATDVGVLVITFSEPIDPETFEPVSWNVELALQIMLSGVEPTWSEGNTVMTVALPELPVGLEMEIAFAGYADASGNVQPATTDWYGKVAGTADIYPMDDGLRQYWYGSWSRGLEGSETPAESGSGYDYRQVEVQLNGDVHVVNYDSDAFTAARRWDVYDRLAGSIEWLGFADGGDGGTPDEILFNSPLKYLPLPMVAGSWADNTTVNVPGEGTYTATFTAQVFARADLPLDLKQAIPMAGIYYKGAWKVVRSMEVELDGTWFTTMGDTTWYSPTLGPVWEVTREDYAARGPEDPAGWYRTEMWRNPAGAPIGLK